jgi:hypothetical protein
VSKFTAEKSDEIIAAMKAGAGVVRASEIAGITRQTVWNWRKAGRVAREGPQYEFDLEVLKLEAADIASAERTVKAAMRQRDDTRTALNAATWFLERRAPDEYARNDKLTIDHGNLAVQLLDFLRERLDADTYDRVLDAISPDGGEPEATILQLK